MSSNRHYYSNSNQKCYRGAKEYIENHSIKLLLSAFAILEDSDQGKMVIKALKENHLMYDQKYINKDVAISDLYVSNCKFCSTNYAKWKLIGITTEDATTILKCVMPYVCCEKCFRKRFCYQDQSPNLCGYAVIPPSDYSTEKYKSIGSQLVPKSSLSPVKSSFNSFHDSRPAQIPSQNPSQIPFPNIRPAHPIRSISQSSVTASVNKTTVTHQKNSTGPIILSPPSTHHIPVRQPSRPSFSTTHSSITVIEHKVENTPTPEVVQDSPEPPAVHTAPAPSVLHEPPTPSPTTPPSPMIELPDEYVITLQCRHNGFFHSWYNSFFVINKEAVIRYPNESRNDRKRKEIFLYDATFNHSIIHSDHKRPYCVIIQPGPYSGSVKPFIVNLFTQENEETFLNELEAYAKYARLTPPSYSAGEEESE